MKARRILELRIVVDVTGLRVDELKLAREVADFLARRLGRRVDVYPWLRIVVDV